MKYEIVQIAHFCWGLFSYLSHYARSQSLLENLNQKFWLQKISLRHHSPFTQIEEIKTSLSKSILTWVAPYLGVLLPSTYTLHICLHVNNKCRNPDFCLFKTFMGGGYCRNTEDVIKGEREVIQWTWSKWLKCSKITSFCFMKLMLALLQKYPFLMPYIFFKDIDQILITSFLKEFLDST